MQKLSIQLLTWYQKSKRDLPFRHTKDAYKIWLSEIMLQQTTVATVIDYYNRFTKKFPTIKSVAKAPETELLKLWQGLGYYSRIRNFKKACEMIISEFNGAIPTSAQDLKKLPGIGPYTAAADASIAFGEPIAVVDGNVKRVLARLFVYKNDISSKEAEIFFSKKSQELLDVYNPGDFNQAMMELGATTCTPRAPKCLICPIKDHCQSFGKNPELLPIKKSLNFIEVEYAALLAHSKNKILLKTAQETNLIRNMWELPCFYDENAAQPEQSWKRIWPKHFNEEFLRPTGKVRHSITNKKIVTRVYALETTDSQLTKLAAGDFKAIEKSSLGNIALNTLSRKILKTFLGK